MLYCFTTCAFNYLPNAVLLAKSVERHLPDARRILLVTDEVAEGYDAGWTGFHEVWTIEDLRADLEHPRAWAFGHTVMELATAVKGFVLAKLLEREDCDAALFFDPDCELHSAVPQVLEALETHDIALTPHTCLPHLNADWIKFEINQLKVGAFNLGFLGVKRSPAGREFAQWWWHRLQRHCIIDPSRHLFTDQKWIDLVPSYFDRVAVLRDPTLNVARWNTFQREASRGPSGEVLIDGQPLDFIHYSGFLKIGSNNKGLYDVLSEPWVKDIDVLDDLTEDYARRLHPYQSRPECQAEWGFGRYRNGTEIPLEHRRVFKSHPGQWSSFPDPFEGSETFLRKIKELMSNTVALSPKKKKKLSLLDRVRKRF